MNIYFPENIFTKAFYNALDEQVKSLITFKPSALIAKDINKDNESVGLIPTMEVLSNKELFVSRKVGISFEGQLSLSYIYYPENNDVIERVNLAGDVSSMEVFLTKLLFKELYNIDCEIVLQTKAEDEKQIPFVLIGDENFIKDKYLKGISFAEEVVDVLSAPYVNYILASNNQSLLAEYEGKLFETAQNIDSKYLIGLDKFSEDTANFISENFDKVFFKLDQQDVEGIKELIQLPFYYGILKDIVEIKFI